MAKKGYIICKNNKKNTVNFEDCKISGFNIKPRNKVNYPGIKVNQMAIYNSAFIEKLLKKKTKRKLDLFVKFMISVVEDDDTNPDDVTKALNELSRYKSIIINKYNRYLDEKYIKRIKTKNNLYR